MKISIIIPMYNEERYISRCLNSLKKQSIKDFELILIDDGSSDNTIKEAENFKNDFDLTILKQNHGGPGKARNWGASIAKGEILIFVDADMFFDEKYIEELTKPIINGQEIGTNHGTELVGNIENPIARAWGIIRYKYDKNNIRSSVYRAILKNVFITAGGFDISKGYFDDDLSKVNNGKGSLIVEKAICYHNNPEKLKEGFKHSIWVGKGLMQSGQIKNYLIKYKTWVISFILILIIGSIILLKNNHGLIIPVIFILTIVFLILLKTIQRTIKEKYLSHLFFVPIVMTTRGLGYGIGIIKYFIKK